VCETGGKTMINLSQIFVIFGGVAIVILGIIVFSKIIPQMRKDMGVKQEQEE